MSTADELLDGRVGVPLSIVQLNRWLLVTGVVLGLVLQQPLLTTLLFALLVPAVLVGERGSVVALVGRRLLARQIAAGEVEDRGLMRFNNTLALLLLGGAQLAFALGAPTAGWTLAVAVAVAALVALLGFCVGCFLYYQLKLQRYQLFGK